MKSTSISAGGAATVTALQDGANELTQPLNSKTGYRQEDEFQVTRQVRLTSALRSQFAQLSTSKSLEGLADVLAQLVPQLGYLNGADGQTGAKNWVSARVDQGSRPSVGLSISNPKARPGTVLGLIPVAGDVNRFSVQTRANAFRLRQPGEDDAAYDAAIYPVPGPRELNWIRDVEVSSRRVKVVLERDADGSFYDRGTRFQELVLDCRDDGSVARATIRNGDWYFTRALWNEKTVNFPQTMTIEPVVSLG